MAVQFAQKLKDLRDAALCNSRSELRFAFSMVADVLVEPFDSDSHTLRIDRRGAFEALEIARAAAEVIDACRVLESHLFASRAEHCFEEFELPANRSYESIASFLEHDIRSAVVENPFVYVVWSRNPERYLYVGRTRDSEPRLRLDGRGKLFTALQHGALITVMHPSPASTSTASDVEAAILSVLDRQRLLCDRAGKSDKVQRALGAAQLAEIGRLLVELASRFRAPADRLGASLGGD